MKMEGLNALENNLSFSYIDGNSSYKVVVNNICKYYNCKVVFGINANVIMTDILRFVDFFTSSKKTLFWLDTPVYRAILPNLLYRDNKEFLVNSEQTRRALWRSLHINAEILPYPIFPPDVKPPSYDDRHGFITIGNNLLFDRKNINLENEIFIKMGIRDKLKIISNEGVADIHGNYNLSDEDKWNLLSHSRFYVALSKVEGQGLPPLEALSVGTPVIYLDAHAFREFLNDRVGIPVPVREEYDIVMTRAFTTMWFHVYEPDEKELIRAIQRAMEMSKDEYEEMSYRAREYAISNFSHKNIVEKKLNDFLSAFFHVTLKPV